jgi:hypothetical protein
LPRLTLLSTGAVVGSGDEVAVSVSLLKVKPPKGEVEVVSAGAASVDSDALEEAAAELGAASEAETEVTADEAAADEPDAIATAEEPAADEVETSETAAELDGSNAPSVFEAATEETEAVDNDTPDAEPVTLVASASDAVEAADCVWPAESTVTVTVLTTVTVSAEAPPVAAAEMVVAEDTDAVSVAETVGVAEDEVTTLDSLAVDSAEVEDVVIMICLRFS